MKEEATLGLRSLTDADLGFLMTSRNYGGAVIMAFLMMNKDAAVLDLLSADKAELMMRKTRRVINSAGLARYIQVFSQGTVLIISRPPGAEPIELTDTQREALL